MCIISALTATGMSVAAAWMTTISTAATLASTALGVTSGIQQANSAKAQANYQAKVARNNARIAEQNAAQKRQEGIEEARQTRIKNAQRIGLQQSAMAANGVDVSSGTALDIVSDTAATGELDALTTRYNYESAALGYDQQANNFRNQADLDIMSGKNSYQAGLMGAAGSGLKGLGTVASVASDWYSPDSIAKKQNNNNGVRISGGGYGDPYAVIGS